VTDSHLTRARFKRVLGVLALLLVVVIVASALVGAEPIDVWRALVGHPCPPIEIKEPGLGGPGLVESLGYEVRCRMADSLERTILFRIRLPRILLAVAVGGALAAAGATLQALLRNPLADPHMLGVSGGAALGAAAMLMSGAGRDLSIFPLPLVLVPMGAFAGALLAMGLVYRLGSVQGRLQPYMFLLAGVVTNSFCGALIMALNALANFFQAQGILFWLLGSLETQSWILVVSSFLYLIVGVAWLMRYTRAFNVLTLGEESAEQLGIDVTRTRRGAFIVSSLLVGASVSVSGMIGFVGLIIPHVTRLLIGPDYRLLLPASVLVGGAFLVIADSTARSLFGAVEIPVGVVTALCGGPFFIYLLRREGGRGVR
jgi:iron complex transport system permease protein